MTMTEPSVQKMPGYKRVEGFPEGAQIVSMIEFKGQVLVATTEGIYRIEDDKAVRLKFVEKENESESEPIATR